MVTRAELTDIDLDRIAAALAGLRPSRPMTVKALIRKQLSHIEDARQRGLTHDEIAKTLTEAGCSVTPATLRKYLSQFHAVTPTSRSPLTDAIPARPARASDGATNQTKLPRRSLRRSTLISLEQKS